MSVNIVPLVYTNWGRETPNQSVSKMTSRKTALPSILNYLISFLIIFGCIFFVGYQSFNCISKFLGSPQGTRLSIQFIGNTSSFPSITICAHPNYENKYGFRYNATFLDDCGIKR